MLPFVSLKKYRALEEKYIALEKQQKDKINNASENGFCDGSFSQRLVYQNLLANAQSLALNIGKKNRELEDSLLEYKRKYADEIEKRLALAQKYSKEEGEDAIQT